MSKEYRCGMCGRAYKHNEEMFLEASTKTYLDFIPKNNPLDYISSHLDFCPACGLVGYRINEKFDSTTKHQILDVICLKEYNDIVCKSSVNTIEKKILLASIFNRELGWFRDINYYAFAYYDLTNQFDKAIPYAERQVALLENEMQDIINGTCEDLQETLRITLHQGCILSEFYRRLGKFEQALYVIKIYKSLKNTHYRMVCRYREINYKKKFRTIKHLCNKQNDKRL